MLQETARAHVHAHDPKLSHISQGKYNQVKTSASPRLLLPGLRLLVSLVAPPACGSLLDLQQTKYCFTVGRQATMADGHPVTDGSQSPGHSAAAVHLRTPPSIHCRPLISVCVPREQEPLLVTGRGLHRDEGVFL